jgi:hypothetical protein
MPNFVTQTMSKTMLIVINFLAAGSRFFLELTKKSDLIRKKKNK